MFKFLLFFFFLIVLAGCDTLMGEEVARLPINETSNAQLKIKEVTLPLKKGDKISFWAEMDLEYENDLALVFAIEVWNDTTKLGSFSLDALETNLTLMEVKTTLGRKTTWKYTGKMDDIEMEDDGNFTFRAVLNSSENPTLKINKAELVLKK